MLDYGNIILIIVQNKFKGDPALWDLSLYFRISQVF